MTATAAVPAPINVPTDGTLIQVPVGSGGGSIVNDGSVQVVLSPTNPAQGNGTIVLPGGATPWPAGVTCYAMVAPNSIAVGQIYFLPGISVYSAGDTTASGAGVAGGTNGVSVYVTEEPIGVGQAVQAFPTLGSSFYILSWGIYLDQNDTPPNANGFASLETSFFGGERPVGIVFPNPAYDIIVSSANPGEWASDRLNGVAVNTVVPGWGTIDGPIILNELATPCNFFLNAYNVAGTNNLGGGPG